ncbi:mitochondrial sheath formation-associated protein isoform X3 [Monodelphis domestica]|uniref:mitochondrial sheath formation-associated protein isoform X3 n=1 Tax=Monodelphis domestica TaxID=13616 RepID=UPI0024E1CEAC|nr:mitochondrial sheath formation-associated protein isoform X3 [Monodelphis domestica]XP_056658196.1 mitochondrial sheath formation-associated protein isoform X3 [Monodelphis domestica]
MCIFRNARFLFPLWPSLTEMSQLVSQLYAPSDASGTPSVQGRCGRGISIPREGPSWKRARKIRVNQCNSKLNLASCTVPVVGFA